MLVSLADEGCEGCLKDGHGHYEVFLLWGKRDDAKKIALRANPCKNRPKSSIRGKAQKIKIALLLHSGRPK